ncbi:hypothetical protein SCHPADRAFT_522044 [Schizopora paradoxa]|uniref:Uncharacterized protein n=1 Tax=Schizopora paradoxa TaxID=27342 RepID=A0A0H2S005_9AGAM|nr:hypothetical protein SCHPADRAFT_522044 [Schizopora paradoxa]
MLSFAADFIVEIWQELKFFFDYIRNKPGTHSRHFGSRTTDKTGIDGGAGYTDNGYGRDSSSRSGVSHPYLSQPYDGVEPNTASPSTGLPMYSSNGGGANLKVYPGAPSAVRGGSGRGGGGAPDDEYADNIHLTAYRNPYELEREPVSPISSGRPSDVDETRGLYPADPLRTTGF